MYVGWDPGDVLAFEVCAYTLKRAASVEVELIPLNERLLRRRDPSIYWRPYYVDIEGQRYDGIDDKPCSTEFSFTRFLLPALENYGDEWVGFCDADMVWQADVANLLDLIEGDKALMCVKHDHRPTEKTKMIGQIQTLYPRKNWSSLFLMKPSANRR